MSCIAMLGATAMLPGCADSTAGRELFEQRCSQCHRSAAALQTPASEVPKLFESASIRPHRFDLSDTQLRDLEAYLTEVKAGNR